MESLQAHQVRFSDVNRQFLQFVETCPDEVWSESMALLRQGMEFYEYSLQPWPTFVGPEGARQLREATLGLNRLIKSLHVRVFDGDPGRLADVFQLDRAERGLLEAALADPAGLGRTIGRGDFVTTESGLWCIEFNFGGNLGGWQTAIWASRMLQVPLVRSFLAATPVAPRFVDTLTLFFDLVVESHRTLPGAADDCHMVVLSEPGYDGSVLTPFLLQQLQEAVRRAGGAMTAEVSICPYADLAAADGYLTVHGKRVHCVLEQHAVSYDGTVEEALRLRTATFFNGPLRMILEDKRNLALLSELGDSPLFAAEERDLISRCVPWTRRVQEQTTTVRGRRIDLPETVAKEREALVLKPANRYGGWGVCLGREVSQGRWCEVLDEALADGGWVVQERLDSLAYLYQVGERESAPHDVIWGLFAFADAYAGAFLRMLPREMRKAINTSQGATEGLVLEVEV